MDIDYTTRTKHQFRLQNYAGDNFLIKFLMNNFIQKIIFLLGNIQSDSLVGLDAGCGEGHLQTRLSKKMTIKNMVAIDIRDDHIKYAKKFGPRISYIRANIYDLGIKSNVFDFIICTEVLEHLTNPALAMAELRRVAKPNAHLIVSVPFEPFFTMGNIFRGKYLERGGRTPYHCNFWRMVEFNEFIRSFIDIHSSFNYKTFPWLLFHGRFN